MYHWQTYCHKITSFFLLNYKKFVQEKNENFRLKRQHWMRIVKMTEKRWPNQTCKHDRIKKAENLINLTEWEDLKHDFNVYSPRKFSVITPVKALEFGHVYRSDSVILTSLHWIELVFALHYFYPRKVDKVFIKLSNKLTRITIL